KLTNPGFAGEYHMMLFSTLANIRIPLESLAGLFPSGATVPVQKSLRRLVAMRSYMRDINLGNEPQEEIAEAVGMTGKQSQEMYRLLAIAKYDDRYVIPTASPETPRGISDLDPFGDTDPTRVMNQAFADLGMGAPQACSSHGGGESGKVSLPS